MGRKGLRVSVERGIAHDDTGFSVRVSVGSSPNRRTREKRFSPHLRIPEDLPYLRAERAQLEADLRSELQESEGLPLSRGSLAGDFAIYMKKMRPRLDKATWRSRESELKQWSLALGPERPRHLVKQTDIQRVIDRWHVDGVSPKTILNRVRSLKHAWKTLDGTRVKSPAESATLPKRIKTRPRDVDARTVRRVIANLIRQERHGRLRDGKTRARFMVRITTGQRPSQIMRTKEPDVDLDRRLWYVPPGKGGESVCLYLNDDMLHAWKLFIREEAWGTFDTVSFARVIRRAGWPKGIRVYNARHTVGIALSESGVDIGDISPFMGHSDLQTTRTFYTPQLFSRLKAASERIDKRVDASPRWARFVGTLKHARKHRQKRSA